jgi:transposase
LTAYQELKQERDPHTPFLFADGVHFLHNVHPGKVYAKRGKRPKIKTNSGRRRYNLLGGYCPFTRRFVGQGTEGSLNALTVLSFIQQLEDQFPTAPEIVVFLDNVRYHHARIVRERLAHRRVRFVFLPPYSPNLNLIERLWKFVKKMVLQNRYYSEFAAFKEALLNFFANLPAYSQELASLLTDQFEGLSCA